MQFLAEPVLQARATIGEGAIWDGSSGLLHWIDIDEFLIHSYDPRTEKDSYINIGTHVGTVVKRSAKQGGGFIVGLPEKFAHIDASGKITVLANMEKGLGNRMNDGKCDPAGRFWCGSMNFEFTKHAGNLWMLDTECNLHHKLANITVSNGIVWTLDATIMYYVDSMTGHLDAFDFDVESGEISNRRIAVQNIWGGIFDGMTIDADDNLYIALWEGGAILKVNPRTSKLLATIKVPGVQNVTSCALGGPKLNELYITSSAKGADLQQEPNAGALFKIALPDTQGVNAFEFQG